MVQMIKKHEDLRLINQHPEKITTTITKTTKTVLAHIPVVLEWANKDKRLHGNCCPTSLAK